MPPTAESLSLDAATLGPALAGKGALSALATEVLGRVESRSGPGVWIHRRDPGEVLTEARALERRRTAGEKLPLYGLPFAVKDNIDVAGLPTTAACPAFAYEARETAPVVRRLQAAGALLVGKTNLDQFATGLVGVRSPHGAPPNPFDPRYISGGSSCGSAAAVARGLVSFALGTDTAGSGRVPAAFTNTVGFKPSRGLLSTRGVVPACRTLDAVSVFALTTADALAVARLAAGFDAADPASRVEAEAFDWSWQERRPGQPFRFAVPRAADREFFGDIEAERSFGAAVARLEALGGTAVEIELGPFLEAGRLLYDGPWIAERLADLEVFVAQRPGEILPVTRDILTEGARPSGVEVFQAQHRLEALKQELRPLWDRIEALAVPTTPTIYRLQEVAAQPRALNARLGLYCNFVNLLDLAGLAVPGGFRSDGLPAGITLIGPWGSDVRLASLGAAFHRALGGRMGATEAWLPAARPETPAPTPTPERRPLSAGSAGMRLAVVGAHLSGEPLNHQLTDLGGELVRAAWTAPRYRLFSLANTAPAKPGLVRVPEGGVPIAVEVWQLPVDAFGRFFQGVKAPLCIGSVDLDDGSQVPGFLCEAHAIAGARDISSHGGWKRFRAEQ